MKANELRIGNFVTSEYGGEFKILEVAQESMKTDLDGEISYNDEDFFKPIRLTEEWLVKFGFMDNYCGWIGWYNGPPNMNFIIRVGDGVFYALLPCERGQFEHDLIAGIQYVHQLQNLYFALTGKELQLSNGGQVPEGAEI